MIWLTALLTPFFYLNTFRLAPVGGSVLSANLAVTSPVTRQIIQRNGSNTCPTVSVAGTYTSSIAIAQIQARVVPMAGFTGTTTAWSNLTFAAGSYSGSISTPGGWYQIQVQALAGTGSPLGLGTLNRFGCGDIFIMAGQSTTASYGQSTTLVSDDRVQMITPVTNLWVLANDPQANDGPIGGTQGSDWPTFGSGLAAHTGVPVGMVNVAVGGQAIAKFLPTDASHYYDLIKNACKFFPANGIAAVLWGQGESDTDAGTSLATYQANLETIISTLRTDCGWTVPWGIGTVSDSGGTTSSAVTSAQANVAAESNNFAGANTDTIGSGDRYDGTHMKVSGLTIAGGLWSSAVISGLSR